MYSRNGIEKTLCTNKQKKSYNFTPLQCMGYIAADQYGLKSEKKTIITMVCFLDFQGTLL